MSDDTNIEWTDATWNPIRGCSRVSAGCVNCYAESVAARFSAPGLAYAGLTTKGRWNGTVRLVPEHLADPLRWTRPRKIFVNSMSDLFHESLPSDEIAAVFGVMALARQHTFQVLTKRPERMRDFLRGKECVAGGSIREFCFYEARNRLGEKAVSGRTPWDVTFPLTNVWLGVSVEDQKTADERIPLLLDTPAAVRFVSYEPAIGAVDFGRIGQRRTDNGTGMASREKIDALNGSRFVQVWGGPWIWNGLRGPRIDWIIVGGESGPGARPFDVEWARSTVAACRGADVACFVKQMGSNFDDGVPWSPPNPLRDRKGGDPTEWAEDIRVREFPEHRR